MARLIDISPPLHPGTAVWPGDLPLSRDVSLSLSNNDNLELSSLHTTVHVGAHADAPSHYMAGKHIAARDPALYVGPCQVIEVAVGPGERIGASIGPITAPRVLLKTGTFPDSTVFNEDFAALSLALVYHLAQRGVRLIGIDTPSVDLFADHDLLAHHAIAHHNLAILEGLMLHHVAPGMYTLVAPPLPLVGFDASPVRALLLEQIIHDPLEPQ